MSCTFGTTPLIEVSGMLEFLGGRTGSSDCGLYAVAVTSFRFVGRRPPRDEVKCLVAQVQDLDAVFVNFRKVEVEVAIGTILR